MVLWNTSVGTGGRGNVIGYASFLESNYRSDLD